MDIFILLIMAWIVIMVLAIIFRLYMRKKTMVFADPFRRHEIMTCKIKCMTCNKTFYKKWKKGDYAMKEINLHKCCKGKGLIEAIFIELVKTKEELKYEKLIAKWK